MKKILTVLTGLLLLIFTEAVSASAEDNPAPPSWVDASEYIVFDNDTVYNDVMWSIIERLRDFAENGGLDENLDADLREFLSRCGTWYATFGMRYEGGICAMKIAQNSGELQSYIAGHPLSDYFSMNRIREDDVNRPLSELWYARARILTPRLDDPLFGERSEQTKYAYVCQVMERWGYTEEDLFNTEVMGQLTADDREYIHGRITDYAERIRVTIDGDEVSFDDTLPVMFNNRTMVPVRRLAELMGAEVEWNNDERKITAVRAGTTVIMYVDDTTAYVNGEAVEMDAAPCIIDSRTLIPARYISEFLGQRVEWIAEKREVAITENKDLYVNSNIEDWIKPMGAVLTDINKGNPTIFPGYSRAGDDALMYSKHSLNGWRSDITGGINERMELVAEITYLTLSGDSEMLSTDAMWGGEFAAELVRKWGDRGIMCWDLFRVANLIQWGYCAGLLDYNEAMAFAEPAVMMLEANFSSWDEAYENYVDGYNWWSGHEDINTRETERWKRYLSIKTECAEKYGIDIFDDNLFRAGVIGAETISEAV